MVYTKIDFNINYRRQDISIIHKTIEKVNMATLAFLLIRLLLTLA